ncbi:glycosyltransferase family 2 protein [Paraburkholderia diazotrophica]|uniref:glycosyltransferase family 2 protein n=1 Tax=Paraburkholderia diazotrophica TaxID=667676 RepID=UPI001FE957C0|nr:glycosyltransferase family 2 protein [Paraburkholderia diazotrophica]
MLRAALHTLRRQSEVRGGVLSALRYYCALIRREGLRGVTGRLSRLNQGGGFADAPPSNRRYQAWIDRYDTLDDAKRAELRSRVEALPKKPLISVLVPTYNSDEKLLREMIASVRAQLYPHWQLCVADDASPDPRVAQVLTEAAAADPRIRFVVRKQNGHISAASNSALELADGEYVALLDHDDILPEHALFMVASYINHHPEGRLFYSDEDKLTLEGQRTAPYFKPDWNPHLILAQNFFSHLGVYETALLREAGGFRRGFEGSQDHDLILRCLEIAGHDCVVHIPHILYHWRILPGSTAQSGSEKPYAHTARVRAVEEHLARSGIAASVEEPFGDAGQIRVRYAVPDDVPRVSIIIPTRDRVELLKQCITSVKQKTSYTNYEIIVVDNGSTEKQTLDYFSQIAGTDVRIIRDDSPFNFSALNNRAAADATGEFLCLLNNDIEVISPDWLDELVGLAAQPGTGAVGARLWYPNETLQHGGVLFGLGGVAGHLHHGLHRWQQGYFGRAVVTQNLSAVTAACLVVRKSIYEEVDGLDEELAVAFNDVDFCAKVLKAGYRNVWTPHAELYHHESASRGSDMDPDKYQRFVREVRWMETRWPDLIAHDPAYSPNLTLDTSMAPFSLADPPRVGQFD